ncbi:helicase-exonuclease AddAB subunit AddA [Selenomonas ruminantium]|uniref:ATP-dependent helicase/nuclease subunit A n=1 Tax=Selenomonas ruminantium TaxID=971 RepID=A0A1H0PW26_SELRU|nr:helicase-exonuclease AddAB subunit AddA [Selenomonas ruminantium]SDP09234.1 DNA helicase/exodeoxyribonuclease V, subunit A [Selenomonas ruminantium]
MQFTEDQQKAIETCGRNILVAAAAGSGKTRVLVERIIHQITEDEMDVDGLLVVTFTNAAAAEMRERIEGALARELDGITDRKMAARLERQIILLTGADISTFHSFCQRLIRQHIENIDVDPKFRLASEQEMTIMKQDVLETMLTEKYERPMQAEDMPAWESFISFMDDYGDEKDDETIKAAILKLHAFAQSQPFPEKWLQGQQERKAETLADSLWLTAVIPEMKNGLMAIIRQYEDVAVLGRKNPEPAFQAAWAPYGELMQQDLAGLDAIREAFYLLADAPDKGKWDELTYQVSNFSWAAMRGKVYNDLKNDYPQIRQAFVNSRDAVKKELKKFDENYMRQSAEQLEADIYANQQAAAVYAQLALDFSAALQVAKKERNVLDFNDLEHYALQILSTEDETGMVIPSEAALALREKYKSIMVDEYQDTNGVQETILNLIAREDNRFTVGDVKQSIYRFRLADPTLFQAKYDSFVEEPAADDKNMLITMKKNFRSRAEVLAPINFIFDQIMTREAADLDYDERSKLYPGSLDYTEHEHTLKGPLELDLILQEQPDAKEKKKAPVDTAAEDDSEEELQGFKLEAQYIAQRIAKLMEDNPFVFDKDQGTYRPIAYRDIAVLLRAVSGKANILLETLRRSSIPAYANVDGGYFEAAEVRLMLALMKVLDNVRQDIPLAAVLASPIGGFSMEELTQIRLASETGDLYDGLLSSFSLDSKLPQGLAARTAAFQADLARWRSYAISHSVPELIWLLYRETGYYDYVGGLKGGLLRQANLRMLADRAADYERTNYRGLFRFLRFIENLQKRETDLSVARTLGASENVVQIMTIHRSKGLEFPVVIVADTAKGFNFKDLNSSFLMHKDLGIGVKIAQRSRVGRQIYKSLPWQAVCTKIRAEAKAEEMRILYVAMTRAREKLILTGVVKGKALEKKFQKYCKFVEQADVQLPTFAITGANSYLDWVAMALSRHSAGLPLRKEAGLEDVTSNLEQQIEPDALIRVNLCPAEKITADKQEEDMTNELLRASCRLQPMPASAHKEQVEQILEWQYDDKGLTNVPAKLTVTEIKRRFAAGEEPDEELPAARQLIVMNEQEELEAVTDTSSLTFVEKAAEDIETDWARPRFMQEVRKTLSPMERGTVMHTVMQRLDFHGDLSYQGIKKQVADLEARGILPEGAGKVVYIKGIQGFFESSLGAQVKEARSLYRELPFSRMLKAKDFYPEVQEEDERVFTQGVIDLLVETAAGELILIDYKTDKMTNPDRIRRRYQIQLDLYRSAVEAILGRKVDRSYLYLLQNGSFVPMDTTVKEEA